MGKTTDEDIFEKSKQKINENLNIDEIDLPIPLPGDNRLYKDFSGKCLAILDGQIIAFAPSLKKLHKKLKSILPEGKGCHIKYIEESVMIYGSYLQ